MTSPKGPFAVGHYSDFDERNKPRASEVVSWPTLGEARAAFESGSAELVMLFRIRGNAREVLDQRDSR